MIFFKMLYIFLNSVKSLDDVIVFLYLFRQVLYFFILYGIVKGKVILNLAPANDVCDDSSCQCKNPRQD